MHQYQRQADLALLNRRTIDEALSLLEPRDRRRLWFVIGVQASLSLLDLAAVAMLGVVALLTAGAASGEVPSQIEGLINTFGLQDVPVVTLAVALAAVAGLLMLTKSITSFLVTMRIYRFLASRQAQISARLSSQLLSRPLLYIQERSSQDVAYALTLGVNALTLGVIGNFTNFMAEMALLTVMATGLLFMDPVVTIFTVVFFGGVSFVLLKFLNKRAQDIGRRNATTQIASLESIQQLVRAYREVSVAGRRGIYVERFQDLRWEFAHVQATFYLVGQAGKYVLEVALVVGAALLAVTQFLTKDLVSAVATLAIFLAAVSRIMPSMLRLQSAVVSMRGQGGVAAPTLALAKELSDFETATLTSQREMNAATRKLLLEGMQNGYPGFQASVTLRNVTLLYPDSPAAAVDDVTMDVPAATSVALVGTTGAGKSTLADLILGIIEPTEGEVTLSGMHPVAATMRWPGAVSYVAQDTAVVNGDVRSNVALGLPSDMIDDDRVWEALERARLASFIREQPDGINTVVGENGVRLSGGQRQRLGLARALYTRPKLLVLDEATSALDAETEDSVIQTLQDLDGEVTLIIVAHRLATIRELHKIAYLERGRLVAAGTFEEVRDQVPAFDNQAVLLGL